MNRPGKDKKVGLALGGGAARGLSHIGVLKALEEKGIPIDIIAGCSIGSVIGACYAKEGRCDEIEEIVLNTDWKTMMQLSDFNLALILKGFIQGEKVKELLRSVLGDIRFEDLKIPFAVVATDINTGEEVVIKEGPVVDAIRASISIPVVFAPAAVNDRYLVDGIIVNPVPVDLARAMGGDYVIACNVVPSPKDIAEVFNSGKKQPDLKDKVFGVVPPGLMGDNLPRLNKIINNLARQNKKDTSSIRRYADRLMRKEAKRTGGMEAASPRIFNVLVQSIYIMQHEIIKKKLTEADAVISPAVSDILTFDFHRGKEAIERGYAAAREAVIAIT